MGLAAFAALSLVFIIWVAIVAWLSGDIQLSASRWAFEISMIAIASYPIGVTVYTLVMTPRDVFALAPALSLDEESLAREAASIKEQSRAIHVWTLAWVLAVFALTWWLSTISIDDNAMAKELSQPTIAGWAYFRNLAYAFALSQLIWIDIALARRLGKLVEQYGRVNLLDRSALRPLTIRMRRSVLVWIPLLLHSAVFVLVVLAVAILPATGIRRRYLDEKQRQLKEVHARIAERSAAVVDGSFTSESVSLSELVSWEQRLQQAKVWPYEMRMYWRVFLYAAIGLSSWLGAALVERILSAFIG
jgi:hypothetical protein